MAIIRPDDTILTLRKTIRTAGSNYRIVLRHNFTQAEYRLEVRDVSNNPRYHTFELRLPVDAPFGEYTYSVFEMPEINCLQTGILQYFDFEPLDQYTDKKTFKAYERTK